MASRIETLLNTIATAIYGRDMRDAIHDSIEECYSDVSTAKTMADASIEASNEATSQAIQATENAVSATEDAIAATEDANRISFNANEAATSANNAAARAESAYTRASDAAASAEDRASYANQAAQEALQAKTEANTARDDAYAAASDASAQARNAQSKAATASAKAQLAQTAADSATTAASAARSATTSATNATASANAARDDAINAISTLREVLLAAITATQNANTAKDNTIIATTNANTARDSANTARDSANTAAQEATTAKNEANTARDSANTAATRANTAAAGIEQLTVTYTDSPYTIPASATLGDLDGHRNIHFVLKQGNPGPGFNIKGVAYETVADLEADITNPTIGDMYNIGASAPYNVYRWNGIEWEDQGVIGNGIIQIDSTEVQALLNGSTLPANASKALGLSGLTYLIQSYLLSTFDTKVDKVTGKGLSANDFTDAYKDQVDDNAIAVTALSSNKVDKVTGKGLSTNDFTNEYVTLIQTLNTTAGLLSTDKANKSETVSNVVYSSANKEIRKTLGGQTTAVVSVATLKEAMELDTITKNSIIPLNSTMAATHTLTNSEYNYLINTVLQLGDMAFVNYTTL